MSQSNPKILKRLERLQAARTKLRVANLRQVSALQQKMQSLEERCHQIMTRADVKCTPLRVKIGRLEAKVDKLSADTAADVSILKEILAVCNANGVDPQPYLRSTKPQPQPQNYECTPRPGSETHGE